MVEFRMAQPIAMSQTVNVNVALYFSMRLVLTYNKSKLQQIWRKMQHQEVKHVSSVFEFSLTPKP